MGTAVRQSGGASLGTVGTCGAEGCALVHASEHRDDAGRLTRCRSCGEGMVPSVLLATVDFPEGLPVVGRCELVEARVCRLMRRQSGEAHAQELSEALPFLELELHKQLMYKMRVMGLNAAFGLRIEISHGPSLLIGVATATAALVPAFPRPPVVRVQPSRFCNSAKGGPGSGSAVKTPIGQGAAAGANHRTAARKRAESDKSDSSKDGKNYAQRGAQRSFAATGTAAGPAIAIAPPAGRGSSRRAGLSKSKHEASLWDRLFCPTRSHRPGARIRKWLSRLSFGLLSLPPPEKPDASALGSQASAQHLRAETSQGNATELAERLNSAVQCHAARRSILESDSASPLCADSFDWPAEALEALELRRKLDSFQLAPGDDPAKLERETSDHTSEAPDHLRLRSPTLEQARGPLQEDAPELHSRGVLRSPLLEHLRFRSEDASEQHSRGPLRSPTMEHARLRSLQHQLQEDAPEQHSRGSHRTSTAEYLRLRSLQHQLQEDAQRPAFVFEIDDEADEDLLAVLDDPVVPDGTVLCTVDCPPGGSRIFRAASSEPPGARQESSEFGEALPTSSQPQASFPSAANCGGDRPAAETEIVDASCSVVYGVRRVDLFQECGLDRAACVANGSVHITTMLTSRLAHVLNEMYACLLFRQLVRWQGGWASGTASPACCLAALSWRIAVLEDDVIELVLTGQLLAAAGPRAASLRLNDLDALAPSPVLRFLVPTGLIAPAPAFALNEDLPPSHGAAVK
ncbi:unnamed protein product, partial [Polarella glacialis]